MLRNGRRLLISIFLCVLLLVSMGNAQVLTESEFNQLDSLLMLERFDQIANFFNFKKAVIYSEKDSIPETAELTNLESSYENAKTQFINIPSLTADQMDQRIGLYRTFTEKFIPEIGGEKSTQAFQSFISKADQGEKTAALKWYLLAYRLKIRHLEKQRDLMSVQLKYCEEKIAEGDYEEALQMIDCMECTTLNIACSVVSMEKMKYLKELILQKIHEKKTDERLLQNKNLVSRRFSVLIGGNNQALSSTVKNQSFPYNYYILSDVYDYVVEDEYEVEEIKNLSSYGFSSQVNYYFNSSELESRFVYGKGRYKYKNQFSGMFTSFEIYQYNFALLYNYYLRPYVGLRPFIGAGLQKTYIRSEGFWNGANFYWTFMGEKVENKEPEEWINQVLLNFGSGYMADSDSHFTLKLAATIFYNLNRSAIVGRVGLLLGLNIGYAF